MSSPDQATVLAERKAGFDAFYAALMPTLVDLVERFQIRPAHEVLKQAAAYLPHLDHALTSLTVDDAEDRIWLLTRVGYYVGEYFVQLYGGHWFVNESLTSKFFARYVVGQFQTSSNRALLIDPFMVAQEFVDSPAPRSLNRLVAEAEAQLGFARPS